MSDPNHPNIDRLIFSKGMRRRCFTPSGPRRAGISFLGDEDDWHGKALGDEQSMLAVRALPLSGAPEEQRRHAGISADPIVRACEEIAAGERRGAMPEAAPFP